MEQVEWVLSLINTPKPGYERLLGKNLWMLDSGASAHMVCDVNLVSNLQRISPTAIRLPSGDCTVAREVGSVTLGDGIKLDNVLCVPNLNFNLVSISKLCKQLNCTCNAPDPQRVGTATTTNSGNKQTESPL